MGVCLSSLFERFQPVIVWHRCSRPTVVCYGGALVSLWPDAEEKNRKGLEYYGPFSPKDGRLLIAPHLLKIPLCPNSSIEWQRELYHKDLWEALSHTVQNHTRLYFRICSQKGVEIKTYPTFRGSLATINPSDGKVQNSITPNLTASLCLRTLYKHHVLYKSGFLRNRKRGLKIIAQMTFVWSLYFHAYENMKVQKKGVNL